MDTQEPYDPKSFWDEKARSAGRDFESAVCLDNPTANKIIDRIQRRFIRMAFRQIRRRMDLAGGKILDYGCGTGRWVEFFRNSGLEYTGVDISTEMVRIASDRFPDADISAIDSEGLRFQSQTFDLVCSIAVIHHNPYDEQSLILHQLSRIIKPKGFLVLFEGIGLYDPGNVLEYPRSLVDWRKSLQVLGFELIWSRQTRYFSTRTIMNKLVGEDRFPALSNTIGFHLDPYLGSFLPSRLHTRGAMIFQKFPG